jgi:hypothetical protein
MDRLRLGGHGVVKLIMEMCEIEFIWLWSFSNIGLQSGSIDRRQF